MIVLPMVPEDVCFCFRADAIFLCVSSTWSNKELFLGSHCVWGRSWGPGMANYRQAVRSLVDRDESQQEKYAQGQGWADSQPEPHKRTPFSGLSAADRLWLRRVQIQIDMLGLKIQSCEVGLV